MSKLDFGKAYYTLITAASAILPPYLFIFEFFNDLFTKLNLVPLLLLCLAINLPGLILMNIVIRRGVEKVLGNDIFYKQEDKDRAHSNVALFAAVLTSVGYYVPTALTYFSETLKYLSKKEAISEVVIIQIAIIGFTLLLDLKKDPPLKS